MKKKNYLRILKILIPILIIKFSFLNAQQAELSSSEIKASAYNNYKDGNYAEALKSYEILLKRYPKDSEYNYYTGLCLFRLDREIDRSVELLSYALISPDAPVNIYYYLGLIYLRNYQFSEAKSSFEKFLNKSSKQEKRSYDAEKQLQHVLNAIELSKQYNPYKIIAYSEFSFADSTHIQQVISAGGQLKVKPPAMKTAGEQEGDAVNYFFLPKFIVNGEYVYISGYKKGGKGGLELFRVKYIDGIKWGSLEPISSLNTPYDEILPYFDPIGSDLYFASSGYNSMGGFDIFKSHYDEKNKIWSEPVNLGFPVNSPMDEYLFMPGANLGTILLVTQRGGNNEALSAYRINIREPKQSLEMAEPEELKKIAALSDEKLAESHRISPSDVAQTKDKEVKDISFTAEEKDQAQEDNSYNSVLKKALNYQFKADSLLSLSKNAMKMVREAKETEDKDRLQKDIKDWEKAAEEYQQKADDQYKIVKNIEAEKKKELSINTDEESESLTTPASGFKESSSLPDISQFKERYSNSEKLNLIEEKGVDRTTNFVILDKSPYSETNPFPQDIPVPAGPFYTIQLAVYSKKISYDTFGGLSPITAETIPDKNMKRYYTGKFNIYDEAVRALETVKKAGYKDAFIVSWYNGQKLPPSKVHELEKRK